MTRNTKHSNFNAIMGNLNNLFHFSEEDAEFEKHAMAAKAHAKIRRKVVLVLIIRFKRINLY